MFLMIFVLKLLNFINQIFSTNLPLNQMSPDKSGGGWNTPKSKFKGEDVPYFRVSECRLFEWFPIALQIVQIDFVGMKNVDMGGKNDPYVKISYKNQLIRGNYASNKKYSINFDIFFF